MSQQEIIQILEKNPYKTYRPEELSKITGISVQRIYKICTRCTRSQFIEKVKDATNLIKYKIKDNKKNLEELV